MKKKVNIQNKKARFEYEILETYIAGIQLLGTEIKTIRMSKANISDSFCQFDSEELFVINMHIEPYDFGNYFNHNPKRIRKLLLQKRELKKLHKKKQNIGLTIIPLRLFLNEKGLAKLEIALCRGKKLHDKRQTLKDRDNKRQLDRIKKKF